MTLDQAFNMLNAENGDVDKAKKNYRSLVKKLHPDGNEQHENSGSLLSGYAEAIKMVRIYEKNRKSIKDTKKKIHSTISMFTLKGISSVIKNGHIKSVKGNIIIKDTVGLYKNNRLVYRTAFHSNFNKSTQKMEIKINSGKYDFTDIKIGECKDVKVGSVDGRVKVLCNFEDIEITVIIEK